MPAGKGERLDMAPADLTEEEQELLAEVDAYRKAWCRCGRSFQEHVDGPMVGAASSQKPCARFTPTDEIGPPERIPFIGRAAAGGPSELEMEQRLNAYVHRAADALEARGEHHRAARIRALSEPDLPYRRRRR